MSALENISKIHMRVSPRQNWETDKVILGVSNLDNSESQGRKVKCLKRASTRGYVFLSFITFEAIITPEMAIFQPGL